MLGEIFAELTAGSEDHRTHSVHGIGVDLWVDATFVPYAELLDPKLPSAYKRVVRDVGLAVFHDAASSDELRRTGSLWIDLRDSHMAPKELPSARYFFAHERTFPAGPFTSYTSARGRFWATSFMEPATPYSPLVLRAVLERVEGAVIAAYSSPTADLFAQCARRGALKEGLRVLADLYGLDAVGLWQFDENQRKFLSTVTYAMGNAPLRVPVVRHEETDRRGIVSVVRPDRTPVVYDAKDRSAWQPATAGDWQPYDASLFKSNSWRSSIAIPIVHSGRLVGALTAYSSREAAALVRWADALTEHASIATEAILVQRDQTTLADLERKYDEGLLRANVSLGALSLAHDVLQYSLTVRHALVQAGGYVETGQTDEALEQIGLALDTMRRTEPVMQAMRKLATEARADESGRAANDTRDVGGVIRELEPLLRAILPQFTKRNRLTPERIRTTVEGTPRPVAIAPIAIERIVMNLCVNAAQARASSVTVTAHFDRSDDMLLVVRDDGKGIPRAARERVFDRFYSGRGGSGLGLYVVRAIVTRAGGEIFVQSVDQAESVEYRGTTVTVRLPIVDGSDRTM